MKPFINCKYESIYNVLRNFNKDTTFFNMIYCFEIQEEKDVLQVHPKSKSSFRDFLKLYKIQEITTSKTDNLKEYLTENLKNGNCIVIKADLYYQKFSNKYFNIMHKKHNVFIKKIIDEDVTIIENEFADSDIYIEMNVNIKDIEEWYNGYINNYYDNKIDVEDTLYLYTLNNEIYIPHNEINKILSKTVDVVQMEDNFKEIISYNNNKHSHLSELQTYTNLLNYKFKELSKLENLRDINVKSVILQQISNLNQIRKLVIKDARKVRMLDRFINLEKSLIDILKIEMKQESLKLVLRSKEHYKVIKEKYEIDTYYKNICDVHVYKKNKLILDIENKEDLKELRNIEFNGLVDFISDSYVENKRVIEIKDKELKRELEDNGYSVNNINIQRNSINGYASDMNRKKYFFKILNLDDALEELKGYFSLCGKLKISNIYEIIKYENLCFIMFNYDESIQTDKGLLNDFLVENDRINKNLNEEHYKIIDTVINENLRFISDKILKKNYPMQKFFNERIQERLLAWYQKDIHIKYKSKQYHLLEFVERIKDYFEKNKKYECFLSQGDPNALNIGLKPISFDYTTAGYNAVIAEFSTILWSILFNDLYYAPKYHKNSYNNHEKIMTIIDLYNINIRYHINNDEIDIEYGEIKTSKIRKIFMKEYIKKLKENNIIISKDCIYFILMRILCIFNVNEMDEKDRVYSLLLMISIIDTIKKSNTENILDNIEKFINNLEEF